MEGQPQRVRVRRALELGFGQMVSLWPVMVGAFAARAVMVLAGSAAGALVFASVPARVRILLPGLGALLALWLCGQLLHVLLLGAGLAAAGERLRGEPASSLWVNALRASSRSLSFLLLGGLVELWMTAYRWLALVSSGGAFVSSLGRGRLSVASAAAFALALVLGLTLGFLASLWTEVGFVRAVNRNTSYLAALYEAAGALWRMPAAPLLVLGATLFLSWTGQLAASAIFNVGSFSGAHALHLGFAYSTITAVFGAFLSAGFELVRLFALAAIDLGEAGRLPPEPAPPRLASKVILAEPIVAAIPVTRVDGPKT